MLASEHYRRFDQLCHKTNSHFSPWVSRRPYGVDLRFLRGNHDPQLQFPLSTAIGQTIYMHGHHFDKLADSWWKRFYYRFAPWVKGMWLDTPAEQKRRQDKDWSLHNGEIYGRAIRYLEESDYRTMVIGHTHDSALITRPESGKKLISLGSLPEDGGYLKWDPATDFERI